MRTRFRLLLALLSTFLLAGVLCAQETVIAQVEKFGHGLSKLDAEQDALDQARELVIALLRERRPNLKWTPTSKYLRENGLVIDTLHEPQYRSENLGPLHRVTITLRVREIDLNKMLKQDRLLQRHLLAAKLLAALVALLTALVAYLRLEDLTRGYYAGPLRTAFGICVVVIGVGLWWVW